MDYVKKFLHVEDTIGQGAFGRVLITSSLQNHQSPVQKQNESPVTPSRSAGKFALKCIHPIIRPQRLASELRHLRDLGGRFNVVQMHTAHFHSGSLYIVMELIEHDRFVEFVAQMNHDEILHYIKNLLIALEHVHAHNIMHRDIKPANFLYNRKHRKFLLVDFGLAQDIRNRTGLCPATPVNRLNGSANNKTPPTLIGGPHHPPLVTLMGSNGAPKTPTTNRNLIGKTLFPELHDKRKDKLNQFETHHPIIPNSPFINPKPSPTLARHLNLTPRGSPATPNISTKRQMNDTHDFDQMLKKLRVSNHDEAKESVKLTLGAYESPVTNNDTSIVRSRTNNPITSSAHKFSTPKIPRRHLITRCDCRGKPKTCTNCTSRRETPSPRSGTPGYKAPEILLRYPHQTTAVDMWSAGVILACLLTGHTPFFRDIEDSVSLCEIITVLGSQRVEDAAKMLGIHLMIEPERQSLDLKNVCRTIRSNSPDKLQVELPDIAFDLLERMLDPNPFSRITAHEALKHPWLSS